MSYPKEHIRIEGPQTLLRAAYAEAYSTCLFKYHSEDEGFDCVRILKTGELYLGLKTRTDNSTILTLPADWDKFMGILADLKKPKLPEYVRSEKGWVYKMIEVSSTRNVRRAFNVYGVQLPLLMNDNNFVPITEQEFIDGGMKELAEAGYVKGAKVDSINAIDGAARTTLDSIEYKNYWRYPLSPNVSKAVDANGFCFAACGSGLQVPVGSCTLVPALPTTSEGIPYKIEEHQVYVGAIEAVVQPAAIVQLNSFTLAYLLRQGVTELVTTAGRLTQADLELLSK